MSWNQDKDPWFAAEERDRFQTELIDDLAGEFEAGGGPEIVGR